MRTSVNTMNRSAAHALRLLVFHSVFSFHPDGTAAHSWRELGKWSLSNSIRRRIKHCLTHRKLQEVLNTSSGIHI